MRPGDLPEDPWPLIEHAIAQVARRNALSADEREDFSSWARLRLLEGEGATLTKWRGQSRIETYLGVVVLNLFRDYRIAKWGKWRPSAAARRLGPVAIRLETLMFRDGLGARDAVAMVASQLADTASTDEVERLLERLPARSRPRFEREEAAFETVAATSSSERDLIARELRPKARSAERALQAALGNLPPQDRVVLKLRFQEGFKIVEIARALGLDAKGLYPRMERCMSTLRRALEAAGVCAEDVVRLLDWTELDLEVDYQVAGEGPGTLPGRNRDDEEQKSDRMSV